MTQSKKLSSIFSIAKYLTYVLVVFSTFNLLASDTKSSSPLEENNAKLTRDKSCPLEFNKIKIHENGKLCQIFAADFPASMVFYVPITPDAAINFYKNVGIELQHIAKIKDRTLMKSKDNNTTLIFSADGKGTQIDILVREKA
ncbi:hypothetical protein [Agaribacter flavus]|uniref:Uncharacterized protein n=1 Tax=Agaribacter flavus TaxID=1902781 RepID=A0ABV7FX18_9ALTE